MSGFEEMAKKFSKPSEGKSGTYIGRLNGEEQKEVERFGKYLEGKLTGASVASYRSYLAAALVAFKEGKTRESLTSSQKSAVTKYQEFLEWLSKQG